MPFCNRDSHTTSTFKIDMLKSKLCLHPTKVSQYPSFIIALQIGQRSQLNKPEKHQAFPVCCSLGQKMILENVPRAHVSRVIYLVLYLHEHKATLAQSTIVYMQGKVMQEFLLYIFALKTHFQSTPLNTEWTCTASLIH